MLHYRAKTPLRLSFAGGGTDVPPFPEREGGLVLSATIDRYVYGSLSPREDGQITIRSVDLGISMSYGVDDPMAFDGKLDLVKAALRKLAPRESGGFDLHLQSNAPPGSGLGSSSAIIVALLGVLREFLRLPMGDYEIADLAYTTERVDLGIAGGLQDQYAAAFGGFNFIEFHGDRVIVNPLRMSPEVVHELEHNMLLVYTGQTRMSDGIIADQTSRFESGELSTVEGLRMQKELAVQMKEALLQRRLTLFGSLLGRAWEYKRQMSPRITTDHIDELYEVAKEQGALGGKVTGAGGGGYMLFYCPFTRRHEVAEALAAKGAQVSEFAFDHHGLQTWTISDD